MAKRDEMSFSRAFADARREMGAGKTFTWRGNSYTTDLAEEAPRGRRGPPTENAPTESPRPASRRSIGENIPRRQPPAEERPRVQRDPQDASPTTRARPRVQRDSQDTSPTRSAVTAAPASIQELMKDAPNAEARSQAERIAEQAQAGRMPLRQALSRIGKLFSSGMSERNLELRERREAARTGMAKGGMAKKKGYAKGGSVKSGNTDRRKTGMFYDSKSPRGFK